MSAKTVKVYENGKLAEFIPRDVWQDLYDNKIMINENGVWKIDLSKLKDCKYKITVINSIDQTPQKPSKATAYPKSEHTVSDTSAEHEPTTTKEKTKTQDKLDQIIEFLEERPMTRRQLKDVTGIHFTDVGWILYLHDVNTPEFNEKGTRMRKGELFYHIAKAPRGVNVYALCNHNYPEEVLRECEREDKFKFKQRK